MSKRRFYKRCLIPGCTSHLHPDIKVSLHAFPSTDLALKQKWIEAIKTDEWTPNVKPGSRLCSVHFDENKIKLPMGFIIPANCLPRNRSKIHNEDPKSSLQSINIVPSSLVEVCMEETSSTGTRYGTMKIKVEEDPIATKRQSTNMVEVNCNKKIKVNESSPKVVPRKVLVVSSKSSSAFSSLIKEVSLHKLKQKNIEIKKKKQLQKLRATRMIQSKIRTQQNKPHKIKITSLKCLLDDLQHKLLLSAEAREIFTANSTSINEELLKQQFHNKSNAALSVTFRRFANTLYFISPNSYEYIRRVYNISLPHPRSIQMWLMAADGAPGFTKESFAALRAAVEKSPSAIYCSMIMDEIDIRQQLQWDGTMNHGYVDFGNEIMKDSIEETKQVLIFMVVAINGSWKLPVAYFLTNNINGEQKSNILLDCITKIKNTGVKLVSLTFRGVTSNITMAKKLGCVLNLTVHSPFFKVKDSIIKIFYEPCYVMELLRNALCDNKILLCENGDEIKWQYIEALHNLQEKDLLHHLGNKRLMKLQGEKIKVRLASEIFNDSVADVLEFCLKELCLPQFEGCEATIEFLRNLKKCFNILNSRKYSEFNFKKPMNPTNFQEIFEYIEDVIPYIRSIKSQNRKTGFDGIIIGLTNLKELYKELVMTEKLKFLPASNICQDHIESFFSLIRMHLGINDNSPTPLQFKLAYKKLLVHSENKEYRKGDCIPQLDIPIVTAISSLNRINRSSKNSFSSYLVNLTDPDIEEFQLISKCTKHLILYIAGYVTYKLKNNLKCCICICAILANELETNSMEFSLLPYKTKRDYLSYPSKDIIEICKYCELLFKQNQNFYQKNFILNLTSSVLSNFIGSNIFSSLNYHMFDQEPLENHLGLLVKSVAEIYFKTRIDNFIKNQNKEESITNKLKKFT